MTWIILGLLLWIGAHWMKRLMPDMRERLGSKGRPIVALASLVAIILMVVGYKSAEFTQLWYVSWGVHANNVLMIVAVFLLGLGSSKSRLRGKIRHPMLTGALVWVVAHLLVNGDTPSLILFGGLGVWALGSIFLINRAEPQPSAFEGGSLAGDIRLAVITLIVFIVIVILHGWIGPSPLPV